MSELSDYRITDEDVAQSGVIAAPDRLTGTAAQNKAVFDRLVREAVREKYNAMLTAVETHLVWEDYDAERTYEPGNKAVYNGSSYLCTETCTGVLPTDAAHWRLIAARGVDGTGAGDMRADIYDPRGVEADVFAYVDERTDVYDRAETLSGETAQKFVNTNFSDTPPATPDEAFALLTRLCMVATINITAPEGAVVTVTWRGRVVDTHTATGEPTAVKVGRYGYYTVAATNGEDTISRLAEIGELTETVDVVIKELVPSLPPEYTRLQYIQNTAGSADNMDFAYIDTGLAPADDDLAVETTLNIQSWGGYSRDKNYSSFFGRYREGSDTTEYIMARSNNWNNCVTVSSFGSGIECSFGLNTDALIRAGGKDGVMTVEQDGVSLGQAEYVFQASGAHFTLFLGTAAIGCKAKIGDTRIWYKGVLVRDLIPAKRKDDSAVGMYDMIEREFYLSPNGVTFTAGPETEVA